MGAGSSSSLWGREGKGGKKNREGTKECNTVSGKIGKVPRREGRKEYLPMTYTSGEREVGG